MKPTMTQPDPSYPLPHWLIDKNIGVKKRSQAPPAFLRCLTTLVNEIAPLPPVYLIADDYHLIQTLPIHKQPVSW
jgi:hypothetical protein